ncbi:hypothetical protein QTP88_006381 [Uroleucon formosanum]
MTVKISVFAVVLIGTCVCASAYDPLPPFQPSPMFTMTKPYMPKYPIDNNPIFNEFKKNVYTLNQALFNLIAAARSVYNYNSLYKTQRGLNLELNERKEIFEKALNFFENKLLKYRQGLIDYKTLLDYINNPASASPIDDDISIDHNLLNF